MNRRTALGLAVVALGGVPACGGGDGGGAAAAGGVGGTGVDPGGVTFYEDAAPILYKHCLSCHVEGGIAPFSLAEYENAKTAAASIRDATASREMPPFHIDNTGSCNTYRDARWLTDEEIATLGDWVAGGALEGDPANAPALPGPPPGLPRVDATLDMGLTYTPDASGPDDYRCFLVDPGFAEDRYLTGYEVKPGDPRVVHHVVVFAPSDDAAAAEAESLDQADGDPGYSCFGTSGVNASVVVGWAPGMSATRYPEGTGFLLPGGRKLIVQVHYNLSAGALPDRTTIDVQLESAVSKAAYIYPVVHQDLMLPPGQESVEDSGEMGNQANVPMMVHGVFPHMHLLGRTLRIESEVNGTTTCLAEVPDWDFSWQQFFMYDQALTIVPGGTLRISCSYDTRGQTSTVTWGDGTEDEMCGAALYVTP